MRRVAKIHIVTLVSFWLLSSSIVFAQTTPQEESNDDTKTGVITGKVVNESGQPLPDAAVSIRPYNSLGAGREVVTDRDGSFRVTGLDRVVYLASASLASYTPAPRDPDSTQSTSYRVGDNITLVLVKGGVITGTVTTASNEPVSNVTVRAQMIRDGYGQPSRYGAAMRWQVTDDRGVYRIYGLPTGTYLVAAGGGRAPYENDAPTYSPSSAKANASEISVRTGEETTNIDIRYKGDQGHKVSGVASGPITPMAGGYSITLTSTLDAGSQWSDTTFQSLGADRFVFSGIPDGDYDVTSQVYFPTGDRAVSEPKRIKVRGADVEGVEVVIKPLGSITGRVVLEDSPAIECKGKRRALVSETLVSAWHNTKESAKDQPQFLWALGGPSFPNEQGEISLRNLAPGQYQIIAKQFARYWYLSSISIPSTTGTARPPNRTNDVVANWTTLKAGERLSGLVVTLTEGAGSLRGQITVGENEPLPDRLYVYLVPVDRDRAVDVLRFFAAPVTPDKQIAINNVAPGRYWVLTQTALEGPLPTLTKLRLPDETEIRARLRREGEAGKTLIEIKPCQNITDYQLSLRKQ